MKIAIGSLCSALILASCSSVFVSEPIGDQAVPLDPGAWQGSWTSGEFMLMTTVVDAASGHLQAAWLERGDEGARMERFEGHVRRTGDWLFISMPNPGPDDAEAKGPDGKSVPDERAPPEYLWARLTNDGRTVLMWWPRPEAIRTAVREGRLPGTVKADDDVRLGALSSEHLALINDPGSGLLSWTEPMVFVRIGD